MCLIGKSRAMDILNKTHKEFNKGQRTATKKLIQSVIDNMDKTGEKPMNRDAICKKHRVCSNKITDLLKYITALKSGESKPIRGCTGYTYQIEV